MSEDSNDQVPITTGLNLGEAFPYHVLQITLGNTTWSAVMAKRKQALDTVRKTIRSTTVDDIDEFDKRWAEVVEDELTELRDINEVENDAAIERRIGELERTLARR